MITLLSTLMSFLAGGLPKLMDFFQDRSDKSHELELSRLQMDRELAMAERGYLAQARVEEIRTDQVALSSHGQTMQALYDHDKNLSDGVSQWVKNLRGSVRPIVTYIFVAELLMINFISLAWAMGWIGSNPASVNFMDAISMVFSEDEMTIVSSIIAFWFGSKAFDRK